MDETEFDQFADEYRALHEKSISASGETPEFFAEYKIADTVRHARRRNLEVRRILDLGCGVGTSIPYFGDAFPESRLDGADVSLKSIEIAVSRFGDLADFSPIAADRLPYPDASFDLAFTACVFHHIPWEEHRHWLSELRRTLSPRGMLVIFEHNPWNPLTVRAVNSCEFDRNARLMTPFRLEGLLKTGGWRAIGLEYRIFFPRALARMRFVESWCGWLPLGAQYSVTAQK